MTLADCFAHVQAKNHNASTGKTTTTTTVQTNKLEVGVYICKNNLFLATVQRMIVAILMAFH
jgi:hypothetical protein